MMTINQSHSHLKYYWIQTNKVLYGFNHNYLACLVIVQKTLFSFLPAFPYHMSDIALFGASNNIIRIVDKDCLSHLLPLKKYIVI